MSARASPGLLPVSNGSSLGKIIPAKSPPPPSHSTQLATNSRKPDLRVITSQSGKGLMHHLVSAQQRRARWERVPKPLDVSPARRRVAGGTLRWSRWPRGLRSVLWRWELAGCFGFPFAPCWCKALCTPSVGERAARRARGQRAGPLG